MEYIQSLDDFGPLLVTPNQNHDDDTGNVLKPKNLTFSLSTDFSTTKTILALNADKGKRKPRKIESAAINDKWWPIGWESLQPEFPFKEKGPRVIVKPLYEKELVQIDFDKMWSTNTLAEEYKENVLPIKKPFHESFRLKPNGNSNVSTSFKNVEVVGETNAEHEVNIQSVKRKLYQQISDKQFPKLPRIELCSDKALMETPIFITNAEEPPNSVILVEEHFPDESRYVGHFVTIGHQQSKFTDTVTVFTKDKSPPAHLEQFEAIAKDIIYEVLQIIEHIDHSYAKSAEISGHCSKLVILF